jgi:AcrR family transcriptional regulator
LAQVLKAHVRQRIEDAALRVFAARGFRGATMGDIAAAAELSTGNLYRYFETKERLFAAVMPADFAEALAGRVRQRVASASGVRSVADLPAGAPWRVVSEDLMAFTIGHRPQVVILLAEGRAAGTTYQGFAERMVADLCKLAIAWARSVRPAWAPTATDRFLLQRIYRAFLATLADILVTCTSDAAVRAAVTRFTSYHLAGLGAFLGGLGGPHELEMSAPAKAGRR